MRILHFADLHIGVENYGRIDAATGLSTRLLDFLQTYDELVEYALRSDIDLVLFCGDAYKSRDPSQTHQREFARRIARLTGAGIPVFLLVGNHDLPYATGRATALDIFPTLSVPLVQVGNRLETRTVLTRRGEPLQVVAVPWTNRSWLLTREEYRNLPLRAGDGTRSLNEVMEEKLHTLLEAEYRSLDADIPAVVAGHLSHTEAVPGSEQRMTIGQDPVFFPATLAQPGAPLDYVALGHIHREQVHEGSVPIVYPGGLQRVDFGEERGRKGFYVLDLDPARSAGDRLRNLEFVSVGARPFVTIEVRSRDGNPTEDVLRAIQRRQAEIEGAIVRVDLTMQAAQAGLFDEAEVRRALSDAHYAVPVAPRIEGAVRSRLGEVRAEGLTPGQALEHYLNARQDLGRERVLVLLDHGRRIIEEAQGGGASAEENVATGGA